MHICRESEIFLHVKRNLCYFYSLDNYYFERTLSARHLTINKMRENIAEQKIRIPFNKPHLTGKEFDYLREAVTAGKLSGDGIFTQRCNTFFEKRYGFKKVLLTTSCTDALEMSAILLDIKEGDEVILPSYTFVSTANAFALRGAKIVMADSRPDNPNIDESLLESLITPKTKAIAVVHYAGVAVDMDIIMNLANKYNLYIVEDCAQGIDGTYKGKPLGTFGHLSAFSFHETKNIGCGEGGMLIVNDTTLIERAEVVREKGTNRSAFFRGEVNEYSWIDIGSSFLPSEITAAFLFAQLEQIDEIQAKRLELWNYYNSAFKKYEEEGLLRLPVIPDFANNNANMFYMVMPDHEKRDELLASLKGKNISAVFHYVPLHNSPYFTGKHDGRELIHCVRYASCLLRLPLYYDLTLEEASYITDSVSEYLEAQLVKKNGVHAL